MTLTRARAKMTTEQRSSTDAPVSETTTTTATTDDVERASDSTRDDGGEGNFGDEGDEDLAREGAKTGENEKEVAVGDDGASAARAETRDAKRATREDDGEDATGGAPREVKMAKTNEKVTELARGDATAAS